MLHQSGPGLHERELAAAGLRQAVIDVCLAAHEENDFRYMFTKYFQSGVGHFLASTATHS